MCLIVLILIHTYERKYSALYSAKSPVFDPEAVLLDHRNPYGSVDRFWNVPDDLK